jgi:hypothetical protein
MPRREDERWRNLAARHPKACTCQDCTDKFLKKKEIKARVEGGIKPRGKDRVKRHPVDCECASCRLLKSMNAP